MKKSMAILLSIVSILTSVAFGFYMKTQDIEFFNTIEMKSNAYKIYVKNSSVAYDEFLQELKSIHSQYGATIIKTDRIYEDGKEIIYKSGVYTKDFFEGLPVKLESGRLPTTSNEWLASIDTKQENQVGTISDLFNDTPLVIMPLSDFYNSKSTDINGEYTIISSNKNKEDILNALSLFLNESKNELVSADYRVAFGEGTIYFLTIILSAILLIIFCLMCVFYPISRLKEISVYKLNGYKAFDIWKKLNKDVLIAPIIIFIASIPIQKIAFPTMDLFYFIKLSCVQLILFVGAIGLSFLTLITVKRYSISNMLKNFFDFRISLYISYIIKFAIFVGLVFTVPQLSSEVSRMIKEMQVKEAYQAQEDYVTLASFQLTGDGMQSFMNGTSQFNENLTNMFMDLTKSAKAGFVQSFWYDTEGLGLFSSEIKMPNDVDTDTEFGYMLLNDNYYDRLQFDSSVSKEELFDQDSLVIFAPESMKQKEATLKYFGQTQIYSADSNIKMSADDVCVKYYKDNRKQIFSESLQLANEDHAFFTNPVFVCLNDKYLKVFSGYLTTQAISNPVRIYDSNENKRAINEGIKKYGLELNNLQFKNVLMSGYKEQIQISQSSSIVWVAILLLVICISILSSYYILLTILISRKKEIFVKKILGYSLFNRYKNEFIYFIMIYIFGLVQIMILSRSFTSMAIYVLLVLLDILIIFRMIYVKETKQLSTMLKGEE